MEEVWKIIKNYENYQISNMGNVKNIKTGKYIKGDINNIGYRRVSLVNEKGSKRFFVHRLVAFYFVEGYREDLIVNHIDGNKGNNCCNNLEWVTHSENDIHAFKNGLRTRNGNKRVGKFDLDNNLIQEYNSIRECGEDNNISCSTVSRLCNGHQSHWNNFIFKFI